MTRRLTKEKRQQHFLVLLVVLKSLLSYRGDAPIVSTSVVFGGITVKTKAMWENSSFEPEQAVAKPALPHLNLSASSRSMSAE